MIIFASFDVRLHGLQLASMDQVEKLRAAIEAAVRQIHAGLEVREPRFDGDVEVELDLTAGEPSE